MEDTKFEEKYLHILSDPVIELKLPPLSRIFRDSPASMNVENVAMRCGLTTDEMVTMQLHWAGGGNPALTFLKLLKILRGDQSITLLVGCFIKYKMDRAFKLLKSFDLRNEISDLTDNQLDQLVPTMVHPIGVAAADWKDVAGDFEMQTLVPQIETAIKTENSYDPTEYMIGILNTKYSFTIGKFLNVLKDIGNQRAVEEVKTQIRESPSTKNLLR